MHESGTWRCDFVVDDGRTGSDAVHGGFVQLVVPPDAGPARYWAYVVGPEVGTVVVRDHDVPRPRRAGDLTVRSEGLWAELVCETPGVHWTIGLEAFGVRLDDPADALHGEVGERLPVGLDLEWDDGAVFGDVLVGAQRVAIDGTGSFLADGPSTTWVATPDVEVVGAVDGIPHTLAVGGAEAEVLAVVAIPFGDGPGSPFLVRVLARGPDEGAPTVRWLDITNSLASPGGPG